MLWVTFCSCTRSIENHQKSDKITSSASLWGWPCAYGPHQDSVVEARDHPPPPQFHGWSGWLGFWVKLLCEQLFGAWGGHRRKICKTMKSPINCTTKDKLMGSGSIFCEEAAALQTRWLLQMLRSSQVLLSSVFSCFYSVVFNPLKLETNTSLNDKLGGGLSCFKVLQTGQFFSSCPCTNTARTQSLWAHSWRGKESGRNFLEMVSAAD